jgi:hypothetical protein
METQIDHLNLCRLASPSPAADTSDKLKAAWADIRFSIAAGKHSLHRSKPVSGQPKP